MTEAVDRLVGAWLNKARHDIETARRAVDHVEPITDTAVYHCQQAAEKALKAVLIKRGDSVFKSHDLVALLTKCANSDQAFAQWVEVAATLTPYATAFRYPSDDPESPLKVDTNDSVGIIDSYFLSINAEHLPETQKAQGQCTYRSITVDGREVEFSDGFADLHTESYRRILSGQGFGLDEATCPATGERYRLIGATLQAV